MALKTSPTLKWVQRLLFAGSILMLGYCGFVLLDARMFQYQAKQDLTAFRAPDDLIGRIDILRLGVSVMVVEGTGDPELQRAAGHILGTALPGQPGNVGIAGHRDTFFRPLRNIHRNDIITLTTSRGEYRYRVVSTRVVHPDNLAVLNPDGGEILTLVTCYPFYFVGAAPNRFIVRAERVT